VHYRLSIAQKLLRSDSWTTGDRNIALLLAGKYSRYSSYSIYVHTTVDVANFCWVNP